MLRCSGRCILACFFPIGFTLNSPQKPHSVPASYLLRVWLQVWTCQDRPSLGSPAPSGKALAPQGPLYLGACRRKQGNKLRAGQKNTKIKSGGKKQESQIGAEVRNLHKSYRQRCRFSSAGSTCFPGAVAVPKSGFILAKKKTKPKIFSVRSQKQLDAMVLGDRTPPKPLAAAKELL